MEGAPRPPDEASNVAAQRGARPWFLRSLHRIFLALAAVTFLAAGIGLFPRSTVRADMTSYVYDDALHWDNWSWGTGVDPNWPYPVWAGSRSLAVTYYSAWAALSLHTGSFSTTGYDTLQFALVSSYGGIPRVWVSLYDSNGQVIKQVNPGSYASPSNNGWSWVSIPLSDLGAANRTVTRVQLQDSSGGPQHTFYVDHLVFTGSGTSSREPVAGYVALTFDDGPFTGKTDQLLDTLRAKGAHATFFLVGKQVIQRPDLVARMAREGHVVGNHTWDHALLTSLSHDAMVSELQRTNDAIVNAGAPKPYLFRPPWGNSNGDIFTTGLNMGMTQMIWSVEAGEWLSPAPTSDQICTKVLTQAQPGAVVLLHDWNWNTVNAVPCIVDGLRARGYEPGRIVPSGHRDDALRSYATVTLW